MADKGRVLVVDDDETISRLVHTVLEEAGMEVETANCGFAGIKKLKESSFDLLITDIKMPDITGIELLKIARTVDNDMQTIVVTAFASLENAVEALRLGAHDFILKPFENMDILVEVVKKALEKHRLLRQNKILLNSLKETNDRLDNENKHLKEQLDAIMKKLKGK